jgi:hypothetical protein
MTSRQYAGRMVCGASRLRAFPATAQSDHLAGAARAPVAALQRGFAAGRAGPHAGGDRAAVDARRRASFNRTGKREAENPTMWLMTDLEALAFIGIIALMAAVALAMAVW